MKTVVGALYIVTAYLKILFGSWWSKFKACWIL